MNRECGLGDMVTFSTITDAELDSAVRRHVNFNIRIGSNAVRARLLGEGIKVVTW